MSSTAIIPWQSNDAVPVPKNASDAGAIAPLAQQLRQGDRDKLIKAFDAGLDELAVEFVWKRTMSILKKQLSTLGMSFVGEMLARPDIDDDSQIELVVTDYEAISLAHQLGIVNKLGAIELRQSAELLAYYSSPEIEDGNDLTRLQSLNLLRVCVAHILARNKIDVALNFSEFRQMLTQQILSEDDPTVLGLRAAPYFFKRTTIRVLLAEAKSSKGAQSENALGNLSVTLPILWVDLQDPDRWQVGQTYAETSANSQKIISATLRRILTTVRGFDYVPETLRSGTYTRLATEVLTAHEQANNFYNEPAPMKALASLGSTIPGPAFQICMRATLSVKLGNHYGFCWAAQEHADKLLKSLSPDRWSVYLSKFISTDDMLIDKLTNEKPAQRWILLVKQYKLADLPIQDGKVNRLVKAASQNNQPGVIAAARTLYESLQ